MTREQALAQAEKQITDLVASGNDEIFAAATRADGTIDRPKLVIAMINATHKLADQIMRDQVPQAAI